MRIQNLYYKLGGKRRFPSNQGVDIYKKTVKRNRKLLQDKGICALDAMSAAQWKKFSASFGMEFELASEPIVTRAVYL